MSEPDFKVRWAEVALRDLERIVDFIADRDPQAADRILNRIEGTARTLESLSLRGRIVPELRAWNVSAYRELIVDSYRLLYRVEGNKVLVIAVIDGRRDLEQALLERLID